MPARRQIDRLFFVASFSNITRVQTYKEKFKWGLGGLEWNKKISLSAFKFISEVLVNCNHRLVFPKPNYVNTPICKIETDKEIMISIYHWMQKLSCHQDKSKFVTPWNCNWKLSLLHKKSFMEIIALLLRLELFWNFSRKKSKIDLLRKTQSNHFWWSSKISWCWFFSHSDPHLKTMLK